MTTYARIDDGKVVEIIGPMANDDGDEIAIEDRFHPDIVASLVDVTGTAVEVGWSYISGAFSAPVGPTLANLKAAQIATLSAACQAQIYAGFTSSALGTVHTYPAKDKDQVNLSGSVVASLLPGLPPTWKTPFWCADSTGTWAFTDHTAAQIQQVGSDAKVAILDALIKNATLAAQVMDPATNTAAKVAAIVW
jgi:hypothetical protein